MHLGAVEEVPIARAVVLAAVKLSKVGGFEVPGRAGGTNGITCMAERTAA